MDETPRNQTKKTRQGQRRVTVHGQFNFASEAQRANLLAAPSTTRLGIRDQNTSISDHADNRDE